MNAWGYYDEWERLMTLSPETRDAVREGCKQSAAAVLPIVFDHLGTPEALIDVGAGEGWWTLEAKQLGVQSATGMDAMHSELVHHWNAEQGDPLPLRGMVRSVWQESDELHIESDGLERWPLALCLETAEHLTPAAGAHLIRELTRVSEAILWSAAIPGQGGDGHINERWPGDWCEGFNSLGWHLTDPFRDRLWQRANVEPWYRQNLLLAVPMGRNGVPFEAWVDDDGNPIMPEPPRALVDPVTWAHHRGVPAP